MNATVNCTFTNTGGTTNRCIHKGCGRVIDSPHPPEKIRASCRSPEAKAQREVARRRKAAAANMPWIGRRIVNYGLHKTVQHACGNPKRSYDEVLGILTTHCQPCDLFDGVHCTHKKCGCDMDEAIADATKHCPLDKPKW